MNKMSQPSFHIKHSSKIKKEINKMYSKAFIKALLTKYSVFIFVVFLSFILLNAFITPGVTLRKPVLDYLILLSFVALWALMATLLTVALSQIVLLLRRNMSSNTETEFIFYSEYMKILYSNHKEKEIPYKELEYIQEKNGFDFFFPYSKRANRMIIISNKQVLNQKEYQDFLNKVTEHTEQKNSFIRSLTLLVWGVPNKQKR